MTAATRCAVTKKLTWFESGSPPVTANLQGGGDHRLRRHFLRFGAIPPSDRRAPSVWPRLSQGSFGAPSFFTTYRQTAPVPGAGHCYSLNFLTLEGKPGRS